MTWQFELVDGPYGGVTEGPAWDGSGLLFTHIPTSRILRFDPETGSSTVFRSGANYANGLMLDPGGSALRLRGRREADGPVRGGRLDHGTGRRVRGEAAQHPQRRGHRPGGPCVVHGPVLRGRGRAVERGRGEQGPRPRLGVPARRGRRRRLVDHPRDLRHDAAQWPALFPRPRRAVRGPER